MNTYGLTEKEINDALREAYVNKMNSNFVPNKEREKYMAEQSSCITHEMIIKNAKDNLKYSIANTNSCKSNSNPFISDYLFQSDFPSNLF